MSVMYPPMLMQNESAFEWTGRIMVHCIQQGLYPRIPSRFAGRKVDDCNIG